MRRAHFFGLVLVASSAACGGSESASTEPNGTGLTGTATNGTFSAQINGGNWGAQGTVTVTRGANNFVGLGASGLLDNTTAYSLILSLANAPGPGTYSLSLSDGGGSSLIIGTIKSGGWGTALKGGTGSVTVTTLTSSRIVGTFTADAPPSSGAATGVLQVRNGRFDITF